MSEAVMIVSGARTAIGAFGGSLAGEPLTKIAAACVAESLGRAAISGDQVDHVVFGNVIPTEPRDGYLARVAAMEGGIPHTVPGMTLNRLCGSGLQAVISAAQTIMLGDAEVAVAGGAETMSRAPHLLKSARFGQKMGDPPIIDTLSGALSDPFGNGMMGITAENVAAKWKISREDQDAVASESQKRAALAISERRFKQQILPLEVRRGRQSIVFDTDEHPKPDTSLEDLSRLKPVFRQDGTVTAGNSSGINDGAAAIVLASEARVATAGLRPMARIVGYAHSGVEPGEMGIGPVPAVRRLLERTGLTASDFDVIESNEAFAAQALAVSRELEFDPERVNPDGGAIALGHPVGATGAILMVKAMHFLQRTGGRYGLVTMCIGGGQGIAMAIERA